MKILHISDFHYKSKYYNRGIKIVNSLKNMIGTENNIDLIFFTGDLVFAGNNKKDFFDANKILINEIASSIKVPIDNVFICPGNHDINRSEVITSVINYMDKEISNNDELNDFITSHSSSKDYQISLKPTENYFKFIKNFYKDKYDNDRDIIDVLYSIHKRTINNKYLGIATINTAWLSNSDSDYSKLLFPCDIIEKIISKIKDTDYKILLLHHPLSYFKEYNKNELEELIYNNFNFMFSGDIHRRKSSIIYNCAGGMLDIVSPAILSKKNEYMGFNLITFDVDTEDTAIECFKYDQTENVYYSSFKKEIEFPSEPKRRHLNKLRKALKVLYESEIEIASNLLVQSYSYNNRNNFIELFNDPILKTKDEYEIVATHSAEHPYNFDELLNCSSNFIVYGRDKTGKTSLLKRIQLELLQNFNENNILPIYFNCKNYRETFNLEKQLKILFSTFTNYEINETLNNSKICLLLDNYDFNDENLLNDLTQIFKQYSDIRYVITSNISLYGNIIVKPLLEDGHKNLYIQPVSKSQIRAAVKKNLIVDDNRADKIVTEIMHSFRQYHLPYNYWTVSIFIWIFQKTKHFSFNNNTELIELYIDKLIDKDGLALNRNNKFTFDNYKAYLSELANYLYSNFEEDDYKASFGEVVTFTEEYFNDNPRIIVDSGEVIDYLLNRKIIIKDKNIISFRLNADFEYFLGYYISNNNSFREYILGNNDIYLAFKNELEIYSGLNKNDENFLKDIYHKTKTKFAETKKKYSELGSHDQILTQKLTDVINFIDATNKILEGRPYDYAKQDQISENIFPTSIIQTEVKRKNKGKYEEIDFQTLENYLFILARIFRNMDEIKNINLIKEVFDFIIDSYCSLGFLLLDEIEAINIEEYSKTNKNEQIELLKTLINFTANFIPIIIQVSLYESVGHINLVNIINEKIKRLNEDYKNHNFELFLLYLLLIDIDLNAYYHKLEEMIEILDNKPLQSSAIFKFFYYFIFKSYNNSSLENSLKEFIRKLEKKYDPSADKSKIEKQITEKSKIKLLLKGNRENY